MEKKEGIEDVLEEIDLVELNNCGEDVDHYDEQHHPPCLTCLDNDSSHPCLSLHWDGSMITTSLPKAFT